MLHVLPVVVHTALISTPTHLRTGLVTPQTPGHTQALLSWTFSDAIFSTGLSGASSSSLKLLAQCSCYFTTTAAHPPTTTPLPRVFSSGAGIHWFGFQMCLPRCRPRRGPVHWKNRKAQEAKQTAAVSYWNKAALRAFLSKASAGER